MAAAHNENAKYIKTKVTVSVVSVKWNQKEVFFLTITVNCDFKRIAFRHFSFRKDIKK